MRYQVVDSGPMRLLIGGVFADTHLPSIND
jgi:hypothetical protein